MVSSTKKYTLAVTATLAALRPALSVTLLGRGSVASLSTSANDNQRTISEVVEMLQGMLDTSRAEQVSDRTLYATYKCYCDDNTKLKNEAIVESTKTIAQLENEIAEIIGLNGQLSIDVAGLKAAMAENIQARSTADALRGTENTAFLSEEADLTDAITRLGNAITVLAAIGGDQTLAAAADHNKFMAGYGQDPTMLLKLRAHVKAALVAARAVITPAQQAKVVAFLQAPFNGVYVAQSGEVVGILKQMKETFESNLASARHVESTSVAAHTAFMSTKLSEHGTLETAHNAKQASLGTNDGDLATKRPALATEIQTKADDIAFLQQLGGLCSTKATEWEQRQTFRVEEEAAISQAIAVLNHDAAFQTFGKVAATSTGSTGGGGLTFLQQRAVGTQRSAEQTASVVEGVLRNVAKRQGSSRLVALARLVALGNPFTKVLAEIEKIKTVIQAEGVQDQEQLSWCNSERTSNGGTITTKEGQLTSLQGEIDTLSDRISHPETGLEVLITQREETLVQNHKAQGDETEVRRTENANYQKAVANCGDAKAILQKAVKVLETYYNRVAEEERQALGMLQHKKADPAPPSTWADGGYAGQKTTGATVVGMLQHILSETVSEEKTTHEQEMTAQHAYEDSMAGLKSEELAARNDLVTFKKDLVDKKLELEGKRVDHEATSKEKLAIERYLESIQPGCDFITTNHADREANRGAELAALDRSVTLIQGTSAFTAAALKEKEASFGTCKATCVENEMHANCQACLKDMSVPGYCTAHATTPGCA